MDLKWHKQVRREYSVCRSQRKHSCCFRRRRARWLPSLRVASSLCSHQTGLLPVAWTSVVVTFDPTPQSYRSWPHAFQVVTICAGGFVSFSWRDLLSVVSISKIGIRIHICTYSIYAKYTWKSVSVWLKVLLRAHSQHWLTVYPVCVVFLPKQVKAVRASEGVGGLRSKCCWCRVQFT